ncbi:MAG: DUF4870 domain-containing protein [bacterium]|nr:DUF4870 domain-containing protein [bacterium]
MHDDAREPDYDVGGGTAAAHGSGESGNTTSGYCARAEAFLNRYVRPGSRDWAAMCHVAPVVAYAIPLPFVGVAIAWGVWRYKRDDELGVATHGREALNFQINVTFWSLVALLLLLLPWIVVNAIAIALSIAGALHAVDGREWRYPFIVRVIE